MKRRLITLSVLLATAVLVVIAIWQMSDKPNSKNNGFVRNYISEDIKPSKSFASYPNIKYISGLMGDTIYLSTLTPGEIAWIDLKSGELDKRAFLTDNALLKQIRTSNTVSVNREGIFLFDGNARLVIQVPLNGEDIKLHRVADLFTRAVPLSPYSLALRKVKPGERDQYLYRYDMTKGIVMNESRITEPVDDGGLSTEGIMDYDMQTGLCSYVTRYANHIILTDTNMNVIHRGSTIDTTSQYTMKTRKVKEKNGYKITNDGPQKHINKAISMDGGILYVNSYMKADNETDAAFTNSNVIDLYDTSTLDYMGSYRLPIANRKRIRNFKVQNGKLYALYSDGLRVYNLPVNERENKRLARL